ncbi:glycosyltransferase [Lacrimispora brassicae]
MNTFNSNDIPGLTIVIPYLNERDGIEEYCSAIDQYAKRIDHPLELVFVDDGSSDGTGEKINAFTFQCVKKIKIITLSKNYGSHAAIRAGVLHASYDICTWMGSDLQEPIEFLDISYQKICEGYDAVYVEKNSIKVAVVNRCFSKIYSTLMRKYAVKNYSSGGISNIMFNRKIIELLNKNIESNSSIMLQIMDAGFKNYTISLDYKERSAGTSKWTLTKKIKLFIDSFVAFSFMPIRLVSIIGVLIFVLGIIIGVATIINKIVSPSVPIGYSTLASIMALGFGITNISLGIIAEYQWRAYDAARKRPVFVISDVSILKSEEKE